MTRNFFDRLYDGFRAEYFIMGELFGTGYEGFKLPGDFGFDILATNQKESSLGTPPNDLIPFPYALQVKSRQISRNDVSNDGPSGRPQAFVDFWISEYGFKKICSEKSGYLICIISIIGTENELGGRNLYFWLHSKHLTLLRARNYFLSKKLSLEDKESYLCLRVCVRLFPTIDTPNLIERLVVANQLNSEGAKILTEELPDKFMPKWKASEYLSLVRPDKNNSNLEVVRKIPTGLTSLANLGKEISIESLN